MDFEALLRPETITAIAVSMGAVVGGVVAVIAEFRRPDSKDALHHAAKRAEAVGDAKRTEYAMLLREECEHLNRSVWIVEKKLADRLTRIEVQLSLLASTPSGDASRPSRTASTARDAAPGDDTSQ